MGKNVSQLPYSFDAESDDEDDINSALQYREENPIQDENNTFTDEIENLQSGKTVNTFFDILLILSYPYFLSLFFFI